MNDLLAFWCIMQHWNSGEEKAGVTTFHLCWLSGQQTPSLCGGVDLEASFLTKTVGWPVQALPGPPGLGTISVDCWARFLDVEFSEQEDSLIMSHHCYSTNSSSPPQLLCSVFSQHFVSEITLVWIGTLNKIELNSIVVKTFRVHQPAPNQNHHQLTPWPSYHKPTLNPNVTQP